MVIRYKNNWINTKPISDMVNTEYDVVIVGSGPGGGAVLQRLCQLWKDQGAKKIAILEKGDKLFHSHAQNIPTQNVNTSRDDLVPNNSTPIGQRLPQFPGATMVYALGGRSLFWNAATPRPIEEELRKWPINRRELDVYYRMAENLLYVTTDWAKGSSLQDQMLMRLHAAGILEAQDMPLAIDLSPSRQGEVHSNAWYSSINSLARGQLDRPYDLAVDAFVHKINTAQNGKRAAGVEVIDTKTKSNYTIRAKNVVVSASTLETPRILLNSGIQEPAIGRYLTGHVSMIAVGTVSRDQFSDRLGNLSVLKFETEDDPYHIQILGPDQYWSYQQFEDKVLGDKLMIAFAAFGRVESRPENRVYLDSKLDEYGVPLQQVQYSLSDRDRQTAQQVEQGIRDSARAMGVTLDESTLVLRPPGADMHESCTCRMGNNPNTSATNRNGQIHGVQGLYVADNSALPSLTAAGPVLSNTALAIRVADHIIRQSR
ncbi:GMC oxidoreductase [Oceanobacillus chungangensis]|uniref:GMC family oxidoreductase n=1 Tax=Oceanobacillus chungangensis TaxID=1229152 RepID=A0A3D8PUZ7_9BACI|nr:GMC family oxidoreductase [Oceanobacillus chungangensis]RDW18979.1 GMC family oxidoreductase [Oceanobacillus chungangensis]